jgi:hypothetical protein
MNKQDKIDLLNSMKRCLNNYKKQSSFTVYSDELPFIIKILDKELK